MVSKSRLQTYQSPNFQVRSTLDLQEISVVAPNSAGLNHRSLSEGTTGGDRPMRCVSNLNSGHWLPDHTGLVPEASQDFSLAFPSPSRMLCSKILYVHHLAYGSFSDFTSFLTDINNENITNVPPDVSCKLVLEVVHLLEPLFGNDFIFLNSRKLFQVNFRKPLAFLLLLTCGGTEIPSVPSSFLNLNGGSHVSFTLALVYLVDIAYRSESQVNFRISHHGKYVETYIENCRDLLSWMEANA